MKPKPQRAQQRCIGLVTRKLTEDLRVVGVSSKASPLPGLKADLGFQDDKISKEPSDDVGQPWQPELLMNGYLGEGGRRVFFSVCNLPGATFSALPTGCHLILPVALRGIHVISAAA